LLKHGRIHEASPDGDVEPVRTLGGEPWGRCRLRLGAELAEAREPLAVFDVAHAAYTAAAARRLVDAAAEHARTRRQFGRAIGDFQAVAHPLADCTMRLDAAATLARAAACSLDERADDAARLALSARRSAAAAGARTIDVCHQTFGAVGITVEGPAFHISRRLRQLVSTPPAAERDDALLAAGIAEPGAFHG
jgi:alkylation response protein AidB-like acyl-CoA dehydrogenase